MNKIKRKRRTFTDDFKQQMVSLYQHGKSRSEIVAEYDLTPSALDRWITQSSQSGSFKTKDNRSPQEQELIALRKKLKQLRMENDILKQAALIIGRKSLS
ncbi:transposase [Gilliamella sp. Choc5-1]|uniref:IS3 family transposase n=3 Tax=Gilliamella sp. Choc5-1 TaxID=3120238 RepID=UPI00080DEBE6|nr:IS3 family transposase [Gilliamella apicola]OCG48055.1 transposase [Gilliamella apicola]OCG48414.1 transposase [Gilliamella apicola]